MMNYSANKVLMQISLTILNGLAIIGGIFVLNGIIARGYGMSGLGEYLLVRRLAFAMIPVSLLGVTIAIPRYMGMAAGEHQKQKEILAVGLKLFLRFGVAIVLLITICLGFAPTITGENATFLGTILPMSTLCLGIALHQIAYSYFRGRLTMSIANVLQFVNIGLVPIFLVVCFPGIAIGRVILWHGILVLLIPGIAIVSAAISGWRSIREKREELSQLHREMLSYGIRRIGANLGILLMLSLGPILMASWATYEELAYFSVGFQINRMFFPLLGPIGVVLLPILAYYLSEGEQSKLSRNLQFLFTAGTAIGLYATFHLWYFAESVLHYWLGETTEKGILIFRLFCLSTPAYLWFELARNPIDAFSKIGYNSRNILTSITVLIGLIMVGVKLFHLPPSIVITIGYVIGFFLLGGLSIGTCYRLYQMQGTIIRSFIQLLILNILIIGCIWLLSIPVELGPPHIFRFILTELAAIATYFVGVWLLKQEWLRYLAGKLSFQTAVN
jgi:O-antigen/teichoic acid export membrane protein